MTVIRSAGLRGFRATVAELGGRAEDYAREAGLPPAALDVDDLLVPDRALTAVLELAAEGLRCPDLGLRVAARQDFGMLGPLALAIQNSPTVADALECASRYLFVHARSLSLTLVDDPYGAPDVAALRYGLPVRPVPAQAVDLGLGFLHRSIGFLLGDRYRLRSVELPHTPAAPLSVYEEFFQAAVHIGREAPMLRLPRALAHEPLPGGDERTWRLALAFLAEQSPGEDASTAARVRAVLTRSLGTMPPEVGVVARLVTLHPRTLQRRLASEGTTFAAVLDEVRREAAERYLTTTRMPMSQVAGLLGLSEQSALSRCCRRWWGTTPSAVRRRGRGGGV
ncbi:AraC family transcriptional regulator [Saccharothrix syringae]|uniref:AraC family transcriptional regulator n=1 Tax=Saccharothrix syringae TaxID=103733 RepID=A0A5Q0GVV3_SACSY|nr:AraC family transcriptional regulator [Saccharothrix syringae]QFZ18197.1 AraC family transcriptional regulator [Saccharothrix syringae]